MQALRAYPSPRSSSSSSSSADSEPVRAPPPPPPDFARARTLAPPPPDRFRVLVFLPLPDPARTPAFAAFLDRLCARARLLLVGAAEKPALHRVAHGLHVSVSRAGDVTRAEISLLLKGLVEGLAGVRGGPVEMCDRLVALEGNSGGRCYLGAEVRGEGVEGIMEVVRRVDEAVSAVGVPRFFEEPLLHMSFMWTEGTEVRKLLDADCRREGVRASYGCDYRYVMCTIGCQAYRIDLT